MQGCRPGRQGAAWEAVTASNQLNTQNMHKEAKKNKKYWRKENMEKIRNFFKDESGANMVEYALLVALIGVALIGTVTALTGGITGTFTTATTALGG